MSFTASNVIEIIRLLVKEFYKRVTLMMSESNDVYVQILPVIKSECSNRILLCKWNEGDFKDRFTGLIWAVDYKVSLQYKLTQKLRLNEYIHRSLQIIRISGASFYGLLQLLYLTN